MIQFYNQVWYIEQLINFNKKKEKRQKFLK